MYVHHGIIQNTPSLSLGVSETDVRSGLRQMGLAYQPDEWIYESIAFGKSNLNPQTDHSDRYNYVFIGVESIAALRQMLPIYYGLGKAMTVLLRVIEIDSFTTIDGQIMSSRLGSNKIKVTLLADTTSIVSISSQEWIRIHDALCGVSRGLGPRGELLPLGGLRLGVDSVSSALWAVGDPLARIIHSIPEANATQDVSSVDLICTSSLTNSQDAKSRGWKVLDVTSRIPPVDTSVFNPKGFVVAPQYATVSLSCDAQGVTLRHVAELGVTRLSNNGLISVPVLESLRHHFGVKIDYISSEFSFIVARLITQLSCAGIPITVERKNEFLRPYFSDELWQVLCINKLLTADLEYRESLSITMRRIALQEFSAKNMLTRLGICAPVTPSVSILLVTKRKDKLAQILEQIAMQTYSQLELVLVTHGYEQLDANATQLIAQLKLPIQITHVDRHMNLGDALSKATRMASGHLVTKMDDDDWYSPHHIRDLVLNLEYSGGQMVGSPVQYAYIDGIDVTTRRYYDGEVYADHVAGGTIMLSKGLLEGLGGWRSRPSAVDRALIDAVLAAGLSIYRGHGQNYMMNRADSEKGWDAHTWRADNSVFFSNVERQWPGRHYSPQFTGHPNFGSHTMRSREFRSLLDSANYES